MEIFCSLPSALVLGRNVQDTVGIDVEGDLDLGHTTRCRLDAVEAEVAQQLVVGKHLTLALADADVDRGLVVRSGGKVLGLS